MAWVTSYHHFHNVQCGIETFSIRYSSDLQKKNAQACDKLIDTGAIITGE